MRSVQLHLGDVNFLKCRVKINSSTLRLSLERVVMWLNLLLAPPWKKSSIKYFRIWKVKVEPEAIHVLTNMGYCPDTNKRMT